ncbi:uncharacterized protein BDR25DRAFT_355823 [Lindgomyces ingoldianus]|uniref:Uncharacterized protein n=1 Tax=Lindgomyces ingoldianus TaxID=673940 RepID=A0ACB6QSZ9_9PLEO|nr:uncharacterized protein BDR25DRAFT_355823 [Lindgomyces ingoldianus]KAF2470114.1 hypothetical protein BDR25DRAFT_355823 [Lindgomyces ingoldianus]
MRLEVPTSDLFDIKARQVFTGRSWELEELLGEMGVPKTAGIATLYVFSRKRSAKRSKESNKRSSDSVIGWAPCRNQGNSTMQRLLCLGSQAPHYPTDITIFISSTPKSPQLANPQRVLPSFKHLLKAKIRFNTRAESSEREAQDPRKRRRARKRFLAMSHRHRHADWSLHLTPEQKGRCCWGNGSFNEDVVFGSCKWFSPSTPRKLVWRLCILLGVFEKPTPIISLFVLLYFGVLSSNYNFSSAKERHRLESIIASSPTHPSTHPSHQRCEAFLSATQDLNPSRPVPCSTLQEASTDSMRGFSHRDIGGLGLIGGSFYNLDRDEDPKREEFRGLRQIDRARLVEGTRVSYEMNNPMRVTSTSHLHLHSSVKAGNRFDLGVSLKAQS